MQKSNGSNLTNRREKSKIEFLPNCRENLMFEFLEICGKILKLMRNVKIQIYKVGRRI